MKSNRQAGDGSRTRVYLEEGKTWTFAVALDWPGWSRRGKGEAKAIEALIDYAGRYARVVGPKFELSPIEIVGRVTGNATTEFGAPNVAGPWDDEKLSVRELARLVKLLQAGWNYFDDVVRHAPANLRKGPRGGGRDRDSIVKHVREAERAYGSRLGSRVPPGTAWVDQRTLIINALHTPLPGTKWPAQLGIRRCAWHVLDHAWEIEDKGE